MEIIKKAILPLGFLASGIPSGIKKSGKPDLALFYSECDAKAACVFTSNSIPAAPVVFDKKCLSRNKSFRAILANSGNANAFCGSSGLRSAQLTAQKAAVLLRVKKNSVLVASTGIIGRSLPVAKINKALPKAIEQLSAVGITAAAKAILTTDTFVKEISVKLVIGGKEVTVCGIAKGAGMIAPNMATMLSFIFTDAHIGQGAVARALKTAVNASFNCITVDGCMSTNDSVMLLANGLAGNSLIERGAPLNAFVGVLKTVCLSLARMIVQDAEGATKFITIKVLGAKSEAEAKTIALAIANSALFKTAIFGENPNFGRIVAAVGASGVAVKEDKLKIKVSALDKGEVLVSVAVGRGSSQAVIYTSDLTYEYIKINAEYN